MIIKMLNNLKLRTHMMISIGTIAFLAFAVTITFVSIRTGRMAEVEAMDKAREIANRYGNSVKAEIDEGMGAVRTLARAFEGIKKSGATPDRKVMNEIIAQVLSDNSGFIGMASCWEPDALDGRDSEFANTPNHDKTGRYIPYLYREGGGIKSMALEVYETEGWYTRARSTGDETITSPFVYRVGNKDVLMTTMSSPIRHNGRFAGIVTADIDLSGFNKVVSEIKVFETGYISIISNDGIYVSHPDAERIGKPFFSTNPWAQPFMGKIKSGKGFITESHSETSGEYVERICVPIKVGRTTTPWAVLVSIPHDKITAEARSLMYMEIGIGALSLLALLVVIFIITRSITTPLIKGVGFAQRMSDGDFTHKLDIDQKDEIGVLARALNSMTSNIGAIFRDVKSGVETLHSSSTELSAISQQMAAGSEETSGKSGKVNNAALDMNANMNSVAAASEQAMTNLNLVAAATEEMSSTINEIAENTENARGITGNAVEQARSASGRVNELGEAAREIGKVTQVITDISEQTNLLALNATIEAARAGEAGKGFAVVAGEIKDLARQTAGATSEIKKEIENIRGTISVTVDEIKHILDVNNEVNDIVSNIATAVEEQSVTTKEVAENISQASMGFSDVNKNVIQSAAVTQDMTKDISEINQAAGEMSNSSSQVMLSAEQLMELARQLSETVKMFKV
ncbi:MAG: methyl-accepting chemotaxis protein [Desulfobacteraceae bacterium]|nr:methyl-accepting chemotaxis protein [Desulfobacteraceae bacterium]